MKSKSFKFLTLLTVLILSIGQLWATPADMEYVYTYSSEAVVTGPTTDDFFTPAAPTQSGGYTVQANSGNLRYKTATAGAETTVSFQFTAKEALNISAITLNSMANSDKIKAVKIRYKINSESWSSDQSENVPKSSLGNTSVTLPTGGLDLDENDVLTLQIDIKNTDTGTSNRAWDIHTITITAEAAGGGSTTCTVTYDGNGKTGGDVPIDANSPYTTGDQVTVLGNTGSLEKTGYAFVGWNTAANGTGTGYLEGETFNIGSSNVTLYAQWALDLTTHTPGKFEKSVGDGGYGATLVTYEDREYETYFFSWTNSKWYIGLGGSYVTDNTIPLLPGFAGISAANTTSTDGWVNINPNGDLSGSNTSPVAEFAVSAANNSTHYAKIRSGKNFTIKLQGYDQFSFGGRENGTGNGKQFVVKINGTVQTITHSTTDWNMWRFDLTPEKTYTIEVSGDGSNDNRFRAFSLRLPEVPKYDVSFVNGGEGTGTMTTLKYKEGEEVTLPACGFTPVSGREFAGWSSSDVTISNNKFTMPAKNVTIAATWRNETVKYAVTYDLNGGEGTAPTETDKAAGDVFTLAAAPSRTAFSFDGWLCSADNKVKAAGSSYTMTAAATTFTAQWSPLAELEDIYVWSKKESYGGAGKCLSADAANADAPAAAHTSVTVVGMNGMSAGRSSTAGTEVNITFAVTRNDYAIKSICTYGKLEESAGAQISWDGGTTWEALAKYSETTKTFNAPLATFPTSFKIKFVSASTSSGGLWWRNALITLEQIKTEANRTEALQNVKIDGTAISSANLATLQSSHLLDLAQESVMAPIVTFVKRVTVNFTDASSVYEDQNVDVTATKNVDKWEASATINSISYKVKMAVPAGADLSTETTELTLASSKASTDTKTFTFSGINLGTTPVTIALESAVDGLTVSPASVTPAAGAITDKEVKVTYKSLEDVAPADVNLIIRYNDDVQKTIVLHYSSTLGYGALVDVTGDISWDFSKANTSGNVTISNSEITILANYDVANDVSTVKTDNVEVKGERVTKSSNIRVNWLRFHTTVPGILKLQYSNTGGNSARGIYVNGTLYDEVGSANTTKKGLDNQIYVPAGDVVLEAKQLSDGAVKNVQLYQMIFRATPDYSRTVNPKNIGTLCWTNEALLGGATLYQLNGKDENNKLCFDAVDNNRIEAGKPYIFVPDNGNTEIKVYNIGDDEPLTDPLDAVNGMQGTFVDLSSADGESSALWGHYIFSNNKYIYVDATNCSLAAYRAYLLSLEDVPTATPPGNGPNGMPRPRLMVGGNNAPAIYTGIDDVVAGDTPRKIMVNGQLLILRGERTYDATGRLVK